MALPMITTANIDRLRVLFGAPEGFISAAVNYAKKNAFMRGYNVDFEPCDGSGTCTAADASAYAAFLTKFADALHAAGRFVLQVSARMTLCGVWEYGGRVCLLDPVVSLVSQVFLCLYLRVRVLVAPPRRRWRPTLLHCLLFSTAVGCV